VRDLVEPGTGPGGANTGDLRDLVGIRSGEVRCSGVPRSAQAVCVGRPDAVYRLESGADGRTHFGRVFECRWLGLAGYRNRNETVPHRPDERDDTTNETDNLCDLGHHASKATAVARLYDGAMKLDYYFPPSPPDGAVEASRLAEDLGYDGFFSAETQYDPFLPLAFAAAETDQIDLGTSIAVAFPRSPMTTAMMAWDLARLSRGRFVLGLGTQIRAHITRRFSTEWGNPGPRLQEYITAMRAIWDTWQNATPLRYKGEFYEFTLMTPFFNPGPIPHPEIPVYIAGVGPWLSRMAGEVCDGFFVHPFHTARYLDETVLPNMEQGAVAAGRQLADVERATSVFVMTGETQSEIEQAMEPVRQQISFYASTPSYNHVLEANGWDFGEQLNAMSKRGEWAEMPAIVPDEAVLEVGIAAPIDELAAAIKGRYEGRVQRVGFYGIGSGGSLTDEQIGAVMSGLRA